MQYHNCDKEKGTGPEKVYHRKALLVVPLKSCGEKLMKSFGITLI